MSNNIEHLLSSFLNKAPCLVRKRVGSLIELHTEISRESTAQVMDAVSVGFLRLLHQLVN